VNGAGQPDYFSAGMTDLLTTNLSKLKSLRVISGTSVKEYKESGRPLNDIAAALDVDAIVQGTVFRDGDRLRVSAQLVSAADQSALWAETYERTVRDAFTLQSDLARDIAKGINLTLTPQEQLGLKAAARGTENPQAQEEYLKGWNSLEPRDPAGVKAAVEHFENAVRIDPGYAQAFSSLADAYALDSTMGNESPTEAYSRARAAALHAIDLDSSQAAAHYALGMVQFNYDWDWAAAAASLQHALDLDPSNADAHSAYGEFLTAQGRLPEALAEMQRARELDPMLHTRRSGVAMVLFYMRRYDEAEAELRQILAVSKNTNVAKFMLGRVYADAGRTSEAQALFDDPDTPRSPRFDCERARLLVQAGRVAEARQMLQGIESGPATSRPDDAVAFVYAALGDKDKAFDLLDRAVAERQPAALWIKVDPRFAPLHADPRFAVLLHQVGL
jgi:TolB-like protein/Tfp pilus assembly protein PilF